MTETNTSVRRPDEEAAATEVDANDIADALGRPRPTRQQREVIESPLRPALVVAGAGSGKTETMANRVLWLIANRLVAPGEILGLTFTRKAAGELGVRIRERIAQLAAAGLMPPDHDELSAPTVATYNSFANAIYRDNAVLIGRESDGAVLGEASAWQLARRVVVASRDPRLAGLDKGVDDITKAVIGLSRAIGENIADPAAIAAFAERFVSLDELPPGGRGAYKEVTALTRTVGALPVLLDLAEEYRQAKVARGLVEYSDQVAAALQIIRRAPQVADELRGRHRVVLLDEYQDTSVVQTWLLAELFADAAVMAVGDPHQSIYGWRGASSGNLEEFSRQFADGDAGKYSLSTSWRNGHGILGVANALVEPLAAVTRVPVTTLEPGPAASDENVEVGYHETIADEADAAAAWLAERVLVPEGQRPPSAAMLFRARATQDVFVEALRRHGVPYHVLGISGLLAEPEIADLVCALSVVADPAAGAELVRLLAGSRWRIGVRDLWALSRVASWLRDRDHAQQPLPEEVRERFRSSVAEGEGGSLVDALDFVAHAPEGHSALGGFSDAGRERLRDAGALFARLRARTSLDLTDFITLAEHELGLDIEVAANEVRPPSSAAMDAFADALGDFLAVSDGAGLRGFLSWLREAEWRDSLAPRPEEPEPGTVQLLTIHGAKGLEWDAVVVPRFVTEELPSAGRDGAGGWLSFGALPYDFRGDAAELPRFAWARATTRKEVCDEIAAFKGAVAEHQQREERRLAYVAVTRARHALLITGSFWSSQIKPRCPSTFLTPLVERGLIPPLPSAPENETNPAEGETATISWPFDPLGGRRAAVEDAARAVRDRLATHSGDLGRWRTDVELLLAERRAALAGTVVDVPARVPASAFKDFVTDPAGMAAALARPMPSRPYRATRLGTQFHNWVEHRSGLTGSVERIDALAHDLEFDDEAGELDAIEAERFERLKATFEASPWATRRPVEVERELHLPFAGRIVICKIDAVYEQDGRYQVVDWKTGKPPADAADLGRKQLQLALYRLAYARWRGIDPSSVDALFYFVADDIVIEPASVADEAELLRLWRNAMGPEAMGPEAMVSDNGRR